MLLVQFLAAACTRRPSNSFEYAGLHHNKQGLPAGTQCDQQRLVIRTPAQMQRTVVAFPASPSGTADGMTLHLLGIA